jgi:DNA-binding transcriptional LysR family regulator
MEQNYDLNTLRCFVAVVEEGSFTRAARRLGVPKSYVSRKLVELEAALQTTLLRRSTRRSVPTDRALDFFSTCRGALLEIEKAEFRLAPGPEGRVRVRIAATIDVGCFLLREAVEIPGPLRDRLELEYHLADGIEDLVEQHVDFSIRLLNPVDDRLVAKKLGDVCVVAVSAARKLSPSMPLAIFSGGGPPLIEKIKGQRGFAPLFSRQVLTSSNSLVLIRELVRENGYVGILPRFMVDREVEEGRLWLVPEAEVSLGPAYLVYVRDRYVPDVIQELRTQVEREIRQRLKHHRS